MLYLDWVYGTNDIASQCTFICRFLFCKVAIMVDIYLETVVVELVDDCFTDAEPLEVQWVGEVRIWLQKLAASRFRLFNYVVTCASSKSVACLPSCRPPNSMTTRTPHHPAADELVPLVVIPRYVLIR